MRLPGPRQGRRGTQSPNPGVHGRPCHSHTAELPAWNSVRLPVRGDVNADEMGPVRNTLAKLPTQLFLVNVAPSPPLLSVCVSQNAVIPSIPVRFYLQPHSFPRCAFPFSSWRSSTQRYPKFSFVVSTAVLLFPCLHFATERRPRFERRFAIFSSRPRASVRCCSHPRTPFERERFEHDHRVEPTTLTAGLLPSVVSRPSTKRRLIVAVRKSP